MALPSTNFEQGQKLIEHVKQMTDVVNRLLFKTEQIATQGIDSIRVRQEEMNVKLGDLVAAAEIFVDEADKETGSDWKKRIINKIHSSQAAFLFISNNSLRKNSPIRELEIPEFIEKINSTQSKWRLIFRNNFKFFPVFIDYVDKDVLEKFDFKSKSTGDYEKLFEKYDIWNLESNDKSNSNNKMPSEMTKEELQKYWAELNLQMTNAVKGRKVTKMGSVKRWNSNPTDALHYIISSIRRNLLLLLLIAISAFLFYTNNQESDQTSEVFDIGQGDVRIASLNSGAGANIPSINSFAVDRASACFGLSPTSRRNMLDTVFINR